MTVLMVIRAAVWRPVDFATRKCIGYSNFSEVHILWPNIAYKMCNKQQIIGIRRHGVDCIDIVYTHTLKKIVQNRMQIYRTVGPTATARCTTSTYNVTLRRVRATTVAVEKYYILWVCVCSLRYPACKAHAPYCHLGPARLYSILTHYLTNVTIFGNKLFNTKCVFWFSLQLLSKTFFILRRTERVMIINFVLVFM